MAKFLIIGKNGQVGRSLTQKLTRSSHQVFATGSAELDITDKKAVFQTASTFRPDIIINAAAYTAVDKAESEPQRAYAVNRDGAGYLAEAAQTVEASLIHLSTDYVFDGLKKQPYAESDTANPQSVYGASKLAGEQAVLAACSRTIIVRTSWVFGTHGHNFVKTMLKLGSERDRLSIVGDQYGAPTCADDIADALIRIGLHASAQSEGYGLYHYSGAPYVSWFEFAQAIFNAAAEQKILSPIPDLAQISTCDYPTPAKRPADSRLNTDKIQTAFGIPPSNWQAALNNLKPYLPHTTKAV